MNTVKDALAQKSGALIHVRSGDMVVEALRQMRDNRVRSVLVIDDDVLVGIVTQGECIKGDTAVALTEIAQLQFIGSKVAGKFVNEDDRNPTADLFVIELDGVVGC